MSELTKRTDFSRLARDRIEAAQAAIAAAEKSAMHTYASGSFHDPDTPVAPWVASPVKAGEGVSTHPHSSFAERLRKHEAQLNSMKSALPYGSADPRAYHSSAPADSNRQGNNKAANHLQLPPWSQPAQLPSFSTFQKSDSIASKVSLEGCSRVSTAGSGATIGWAGPWVVTHRAGGADRMYPAHMRSNSPSRTLHAAENMADNSSVAHLTHSKRTAVRQDPLTHQQIQDVQWHLPAQHQSSAQHQSTAAAPSGKSNQTQPNPRAPLSPAKNLSLQQSRIPSPTKTIPKEVAMAVSTSVRESANACYRRPLDESNSKYDCHPQSNMKKQSAMAGHPSGGPGSLAETVRGKKDNHVQKESEPQRGDKTLGRQKHGYKKATKSNKHAHRPGKPAWDDGAEAPLGAHQPQEDPPVTTFGRHAVGNAGDPSVLRRRQQQHAQQSLRPLYSLSSTGEGHETGTAGSATQDRESRLHALQRLHGSSAQDLALHNHPRAPEHAQSANSKGVEGTPGQGRSDGFGTAMPERGKPTSRLSQAGSMPSQRHPAQQGPEMLHPGHSSALGRSGSTIDRLRRLQRTRTSSTQPQIESMVSSQDELPHASTATSGGASPAKQPSQRFSKTKHAAKHSGSQEVKSRQHSQADVARDENHPADSNHRTFATRKLQVGSGAQYPAVSDGQDSLKSGPKQAPRRQHAAHSISDTHNPARIGGDVRPADTGLVNRTDKILEETAVGPGRTGAGMDFERLVELKLQEHGDTPLAPVVAARLHQCGTCGRQFAETALQRHQAVCARVFASKRAPMDMAQQRLSGLEAASMGTVAGASSSRAGRSKAGRSRAAARSPVGDNRPAVAAGVSRAGKWKQQSEQLRRALNSTRPAQRAQSHGEDLSKLQLHEDPAPDDRVPCPHCNRKFAALTAERHIPKCKDIRAKPTFLKRGSGNAGGNLARMKPKR